MTDLYAELDCPREADEAMVKRAYKRRARDTHPDHGGDPKAFARATQARDVLLDPERRRRYDETGQVDGAPVIDETNQKILDLIAGALEAAVQEAAGRDLDLLALMRVRLADARVRVRMQVEQCRQIVARYERFRGRFKVKDGPNRIDLMIAGRVADAERRLAGLAAEVAIGEAALAMLDGYEYECSNSGYPMKSFMALGAGPFAGRGW